MKYPDLLSYLYVLILLLTTIWIVLQPPKMGIKGKNVSWQRYAIICFTLFFFIHVFKDYSEFSDLPRYIDGYKEVVSRSYKSVFAESIYEFKCEVGFAVFMKFLADISSSPIFFFIITSTLILGGYYFLIRNYSVWIGLSVPFFLVGPYIQSIYVLRQYVAVSICLFAVPFVLKRKILPFLVIVLLAFSFHQTAIVFFPVYFLYGIKNKKTLSYIMLVLFVVLIILFRIVLSYIGGFLSGYDSFVESDEESHWHMAAVLFSLLMMRIYALKSHFFDVGLNKLLSIVLILAVVLAVGGNMIVMIGRVNLYYTAFACLYIPYTTMALKPRFLKYSFTTLYLFVFSYVFFLCLSWPSIISGRTYWNF